MPDKDARAIIERRVRVEVQRCGNDTAKHRKYAGAIVNIGGGDVVGCAGTRASLDGEDTAREDCGI